MIPRPHGGAPASLALVVSVAVAAGAGLHAGDQAVAISRIRARVGPGTCLRVSEDVLVIAPRPAPGAGPAFARAIEFRAAARTSRDGEVLLTVEPLTAIETLSGEASGPGRTTVEFLGSGDGTRSGSLKGERQEIAARWVGSGWHSGRLVFVVHGAVDPRGASLPLRFLLTAP